MLSFNNGSLSSPCTDGSLFCWPTCAIDRSGAFKLCTTFFPNSIKSTVHTQVFIMEGRRKRRRISTCCEWCGESTSTFVKESIAADMLQPLTESVDNPDSKPSLCDTCSSFWRRHRKTVPAQVAFRRNFNKEPSPSSSWTATTGVFGKFQLQRSLKPNVSSYRKEYPLRPSVTTSTQRFNDSLL